MNYKYFIFVFLFLLFAAVPVIHAENSWVNVTNNTATATFGTVRTSVDTGYSSNVILNVTTNCTVDLAVNFTALTADLISNGNTIDKSNVYLYLTVNGTASAGYTNSVDVIATTKDSVIVPYFKIIIPPKAKSGTYTVTQTINSICNGTVRNQHNLTLSGTVINSLDSGGISPFFIIVALAIAAAFVLYVMFEAFETQSLSSRKLLELLVLAIMVAIMLVILATFV